MFARDMSPVLVTGKAQWGRRRGLGTKAFLSLSGPLTELSEVLPPLRDGGQMASFGQAGRLFIYFN